MQIEIVDSGTFEAADFANIWLNLIMNGHNVFCQFRFLWETFVADFTLI